MTNGEKIQSVFSNINFGTLAQNDVIVNKDYSNNDEPQVFIPVKVWNAEYKEPTESRELEKTRNSKLETVSLDAYKQVALERDIAIEQLHELGYEFGQKIEPTTKNNLGVDCNNCKNNFHRGDGSSYCATGDGMCHYECEETTKNDLLVDAISRAEVLKIFDEWFATCDIADKKDSPKIKIKALPPVTPQEPRIITCKDCKYYRNKGNKRSYCTKRLNVDSVTDRYREPNFYCADAVLREVEK